MSPKLRKNSSASSLGKEEKDVNSALTNTLKSLTESVDEMKQSISILHGEVKEIRNEIDIIKELKQSVTFTQEALLDAQKDITTLRKTVERYESMFNETTKNLLLCQKENSEMYEKLLHLDSYIRRENLKFAGIKEEKKESAFLTEKKIRDLFVNKLGIEYGQEIEFQRCHRLGAKQQGDRDIIVRFLWFQDREAVWDKRTQLRNTNVIIKEDFPTEIEQRRARLYSTVKAAKVKNIKAHIIVDKLILEGQRFSIDTLSKLPSDLQPANLCTQIKEKSVLFYGKDSFLSNHHHAPFVLDGKKISGSRQYYHYQKAIHSADNETAAQILSTDNPIEQMYLGRKVRSTEDQWNDILAEQIVEAAVAAKYRQNPDLLKKLKATGTRSLIECNPHEKFWGNGMSLYDKAASDNTKWKGRNMMGNVLSRVREDLR